MILALKSKRSRILMMLALIFVSAQFIMMTVSADYYDGFDQYANGTVNPGPWTVTVPVADTSCITANAVSSVRAFISPPNVYSFSVVPGSTCTGGMLSNATMAFNASQTITTVKEFTRFQGNTSADLTSDIFAAYSCILTSHSTPCNLGSPKNSVDLSTCRSAQNQLGPYTSGYCSIS